MRQRFNRRGMTLIEIMIAMVIVAGLTIGSVFVINSVTRANLKAQVSRLSGYIKHTYGQAAIHQQYYRLMIDIDTQEYWVEMAEQSEIGSPPGIPDQNIIGAPDGFDSAPTSRSSGGYDANDPEGTALGLKRPKFQATSDSLTKRRKLKGAVFHSIATASEQFPKTAGRTSITFFPNGFVERSMIVLSDGQDAYFTLEIQPLSGKVDIFTGQQSADGDFFEVEDDD